MASVLKTFYVQGRKHHSISRDRVGTGRGNNAVWIAFRQKLQQRDGRTKGQTDQRTNQRTNRPLE